MDDDSGRLVDYEQVLVLVRDSEFPLLRFEAGVDQVWSLDLDDLPALKPVALGPRHTVDADGPGGQQAFGLGARADLRQRSEKAVKPLARSVGWN